LEGVEGETLIIGFVGPADEFDLQAAETQEVIDSVEWRDERGASDEGDFVHEARGRRGEGRVVGERGMIGKKQAYSSECVEGSVLGSMPI
jgi:hypothetical protein